jgi:DNA-binding sugar fermentation-stimulating protein
MIEEMKECVCKGVKVKVSHTDDRTRRKLPLNFVLSRDKNSTWLGHVD